MSRALGAVRFDADGVIMWFEHDGTIDRELPPLYDREDEVAWRTERDLSRCVCGNAEPVTLATNYGLGTHWRGAACRVCRRFGAGSDLVDVDDYSDGLPWWWR